MANTKMKATEIQTKVKNDGMSVLKGILDEVGAVQFGDFEYAIPVEIEGETRWARIKMTCGQLADTVKLPKFDPFLAYDEWQADLEYKATVKASKEKAKADKLAAKGKDKGVKA